MRTQVTVSLVTCNHPKWKPWMEVEALHFSDEDPLCVAMAKNPFLTRVPHEYELRDSEGKLVGHEKTKFRIKILSRFSIN